VDVFVRGFLFARHDFVTFAFRRCRIDISPSCVCVVANIRRRLSCRGTRWRRVVIVCARIMRPGTEDCGTKPYLCNKSVQRKLEMPAARYLRCYMPGGEIVALPRPPLAGVLFELYKNFRHLPKSNQRSRAIYFDECSPARTTLLRVNDRQVIMRFRVVGVPETRKGPSQKAESRPRYVSKTSF